MFDRVHGATVARLTPDQTVGSSILSGLTLLLLRNLIQFKRPWFMRHSIHSIRDSWAMEVIPASKSRRSDGSKLYSDRHNVRRLSALVDYQGGIVNP